MAKHPPLEWKLVRNDAYYAHAAEAVYRLVGKLVSDCPAWLVWRDGELLGIERTLAKAKAYTERRHQNSTALELGAR